MKRALFRLLLIALLGLRLAGADWALLQGVAWAGMLMSRSARAGIKEAVVTTFDGEHPCGMCLAVREGMKTEEGREPMQVPKLAKLKLEVFVDVAADAPRATVLGEWIWPCGDVAFQSAALEPPTPPPRIG